MMIVPASFRYVIILVLIFSHKTITAPTATSSDASSSTSCSMDISNTTLDCSSLGLTAIPNDIPNTILNLNMSFNNLVHLREDTFSSDCCRQLRELDLSNNEISNINRNVFKNLENLRSIKLRKNKFSEFNSRTFEELKNLELLDLSYNALKLQNSFLIQPNLRKLIMDYCELDELPSDAFASVSQLESLSLEGNPLDNFDATPFEHFDKLVELRMHNLSKESIIELCSKLEVIDAINFDGFNVSCFYLSFESRTFEESIVGNDKPIELPVYHATTTTKKPSPTTTVSMMTTTSNPIMNHTGGETLNSKISDPVTIHTTTTTEVNSAVVDVDSETIKYMLIGILAVTTIGIAFGLVCRADVCSIKTKLCRSNKNRARKPEDSVSPFEEIPLNTVNSNGNGKTPTEG